MNRMRGNTKKNIYSEQKQHMCPFLRLKQGSEDMGPGWKHAHAISKAGAEIILKDTLEAG